MTWRFNIACYLAAGLDVGSCCLAHVNRSYVFRGGSIDPWRFFRIRNVTRQVARLQPKLTFQLRAAFTVLSMPKAPDIAPGKHCTVPSHASSSTAAIRRFLMTTSGICQDSTRARKRNWRKWASSPSMTYLTTSS